LCGDDEQAAKKTAAYFQAAVVFILRSVFVTEGVYD
jgi:hypothetical protein